jgi:hypothetical protein
VPNPRRESPCEESPGALVVALLAWSACAAAEAGTPILVYHRFGPTVADCMTVRTSVLESHFAHLERNGFAVVPLRTLVARVRDDGTPPPKRSVVITVDDGHRSVDTDVLPLLRRYRVSITLFVYISRPSPGRRTR